MTPLRSTLSLAALLCPALLASCTNGVFSSPLYLAVTITPRPASVPVRGSVVFDASVTNNLSLPTWTLLQASSTGDAGSLTAVAGRPNSILYTAPATPPIYTDPPAGFTQGTVSLRATVVPPPASASLPDAVDSVTVFITAPAIAVGLSPAAAAVALGQTRVFTGYAVGSVDNVLIWQVNGGPEARRRRGPSPRRDSTPRPRPSP